MMAHRWWEEATFYQIYPRSFADSNNDGIGDINGIIQKLDYLTDLGIDAIWLSPHYPSPLIDCGYDISDYCDVAPEYGTLDDFKRLIYEVHKRKLKIIIDLVLNHTSDQHPWFLESKKNIKNSKRNWYIWEKGKGDNPPNNWESIFLGPAWEKDETTNEYYYHYFLKEQPDLNWRNPEVIKAMDDIVRFWLDLGIDGFRIDAIGSLFESEELIDHASQYTAKDFVKYIHETEKLDGDKVLQMHQELFGHQNDQPELHAILQRLRKTVDEYPNVYLIGESDVVDYMGNGKQQLHSVFNFDFFDTDEITPEHIITSIEKWRKQTPAGSMYANTINNHDRSRMFNAFGKNNPALAQLYTTMILTLDGIPFLYYGEEIGMTDYYITDFDQVNDSLSIVMKGLMEEENIPLDKQLDFIKIHTRDRCRTPMQWTSGTNGGFSDESVKTWLPVHDNASLGVNVEDQLNDKASMLHFYKTLLHLRKKHSALRNGSCRFSKQKNNNILAFTRENKDEKVYIILNFSQKPVELGGLDMCIERNSTILLSTANNNKLNAYGIHILNKVRDN